MNVTDRPEALDLSRVISEFSKSDCVPYDTLYLYGDPRRTAGYAAEAAVKTGAFRPDAKVVRVSAGDFCADLVQKLTNGERRNCLQAYYGDVLIFEDVSAVAGRELLQQMLYGLFDWYLENGKQMLVTGPAPPEAIPGLAPRIQAQLIGGINLSAG